MTSMSEAGSLHRSGAGAVLAWIFDPVLRHKRAFLWVNAFYWGALLVGMATSAVNPGLREMWMEAIGQAFSPTGGLGFVTDAYGQGRLLQAILITFGVNLGLGTILVIALPSQ